MNYEEIKKEFIKLKKEELNYIDLVVKTSNTKKIKEKEKLEIFRKLKYFEKELNEMYSKLFNSLVKEIDLTTENTKDIIVEFDIDKDFLSSIDSKNEYIKEYILDELGINKNKYKLSIHNLLRIKSRDCYREIDINTILNNQKFLDEPIYILTGYYDAREDCYGPCLGKPEDYLYAVYKNISIKNNSTIDILEKDMKDFEKDKLVIHTKNYVGYHETEKIFEEELLNKRNKTIKDCITITEKRIEKENFLRTPEYKEKVLLDKIKGLYNPVMAEYINSETLYNGNFIELIKETYKLPNGKYIDKEKIVKNKGKYAVIVVPITEDNKYILTVQNRIKDEFILEFPSGYIEINEDALGAALRELEEETGYTSNHLFIVDEAYTSFGTDNSITYIVIANNCVKKDIPRNSDTELINYELFNEKELEYIVNNNILYGAMNKLAYYNLINNVETRNSKTGIYKVLKKKKTNL